MGPNPLNRVPIECQEGMGRGGTKPTEQSHKEGMGRDETKPTEQSAYRVSGGDGEGWDQTH